MAITVYCARCARTISSAEMEDGLVVETERGFFCAECARYARTNLPAESPAAEETAEQQAAVGEEPVAQPVTEAKDENPPPDPVELLREIRNELKPISRAMLYEKASIWNLLGAVGQVFALALLVLALVQWNGAGTPILLTAILVQLMTLTCFVRGK